MPPAVSTTPANTYQINAGSYGRNYQPLSPRLLNQMRAPVAMPFPTQQKPRFNPASLMRMKGGMDQLKNLGNPTNNYLKGNFQGLASRNLAQNNALQKVGNGNVLNNSQDPHIVSNSGLQSYGFNPVADLSGNSMFKNAVVKSASKVINPTSPSSSTGKALDNGLSNIKSKKANRELKGESRSLTTTLVNDPPATAANNQTNMGTSNKDFSLPTMTVGGKTVPGFNVKNKKIPQNVRNLMIPGMGGDPPGPQPVVAPIQFPGIINPDIYIQNTQAPPVIPQINPPPVNVDLKIKGLEQFYKKTAKPPVILNTIHHEIQNQGMNEINDIANQYFLIHSLSEIIFFI